MSKPLHELSPDIQAKLLQYLAINCSTSQWAIALRRFLDQGIKSKCK